MRNRVTNDKYKYRYHREYLLTYWLKRLFIFIPIVLTILEFKHFNFYLFTIILYSFAGFWFSTFTAFFRKDQKYVQYELLMSILILIIATFGFAIASQFEIQNIGFLILYYIVLHIEFMQIKKVTGLEL